MKKPRVRHSEKSDGAEKQSHIKIRMARPLDASPLYRVLIRYFDELPMPYPAPDEAVAMAWGLGLIIRGGVVVAEEGGKIIGTVGLEQGVLPWCNVPYLNGVWFYVAPERRSGGTADHLMKAAKNIAAQNKLSLRLDNVWGVKPEAQDRWRRKNGFTYVGGNNVWFPPKQEG